MTKRHGHLQVASRIRLPCRLPCSRLPPGRRQNKPTGDEARSSCRREVEGRVQLHAGWRALASQERKSLLRSARDKKRVSDILEAVFSGSAPDELGTDARGRWRRHLK
jgi:hypothetical protein